MGFNGEQASYIALREIVAERTHPVLAWVGSGISLDAGFPTWSVLKSSLIVGLRDKGDELGGHEGRRLAAAAELAEVEPNYWTAFEILADHLGRAEFHALIHRPFEQAYRATTPPVYGELWELGIDGMLTLNLDRLSIRSLNQFRPSETHFEQNGAAVGRLRRHLHTPRPFVANLHGNIDDEDSWVFTRSQLGSLVRDDAYRGFIETCLSTYTIVFIGISVDDIAVGGHLNRLAELGIQNPTHFWITPQREFNVDRWCGQVGIRPIRYEAFDDDHRQLRELMGQQVVVRPAIGQRVSGGGATD